MTRYGDLCALRSVQFCGQVATVLLDYFPRTRAVCRSTWPNPNPDRASFQEIQSLCFENSPSGLSLAIPWDRPFVPTIGRVESQYFGLATMRPYGRNWL